MHYTVADVSLTIVCIKCNFTNLQMVVDAQGIVMPNYIVEVVH